MSPASFTGIAVGCFAVGLLARRWQHVALATLVWVAGLGVAALAGTFRATGEDNALGVFVFTGVPTILWLAAFAIGAVIRQVVREPRT